MWRCVFSAALFLLAACGESRPPARAPASDEVPANSFSAARLGDAGDVRNDEPERRDPTSPYLTKIGEPAPGVDSPSPTTTAGPGGTLSRSECDRIMDRYLELEIATNPQLKGVPREVIEQAKEMARQQHGDAPCTATPAQVACAMASKTTAAWQRCLK